MKKIITLFGLMLCMFATAQEAVDTMYIYRNDNVIERIPVSKIDSVVFVAPVTPQYEAVDLGLSVRWASFNVGATKPEEYGGYYAWGETEEKEDYSWETYKWCNGTSTSMTKYCTGKWFGTIDHKTVLDLEDDIAHVKWGGDWRMPTKEEQRELLNNCTWTRATQNGVNGYKVTGPNGNSIFLPAAGYRYGTDVYNRGDYGYFWSSSAQGYYSYSALGLSFGDGDYDLSFGDGDCGSSNYERCYGQAVRPVIE